MPRKNKAARRLSVLDQSALVVSLVGTGAVTRDMLTWDRLRETLRPIFVRYRVGWVLDDKGGQHGVVSWQGRHNAIDHMLVPAPDAAECEWHEFFVLLEMRLKFMPRAAA